METVKKVIGNRKSGPNDGAIKTSRNPIVLSRAVGPFRFQSRLGVISMIKRDGAEHAQKMAQFYGIFNI